MGAAWVPRRAIKCAARLRTSRQECSISYQTRSLPPSAASSLRIGSLSEMEGPTQILPSNIRCRKQPTLLMNLIATFSENRRLLGQNGTGTSPPTVSRGPRKVTCQSGQPAPR